MGQRVTARRTAGALLVLVESMRPLQWARNGFVLTALIFDKKVFDLAAVLRVSFAFALFCLVASGVYILNDLLDVERDRQHPAKRFRPLASGRLPVPLAAVAAAVLLIAGAGLGFCLRWDLGAILLGYVLVNVAYSLWMKHIVVLDTFAIASGYVLRVAAGAAAVVVERFSPWLYVFTLLFAMMVSLAKRRHELQLLAGNAGSHRNSLSAYNLAFFDHTISMMAGGAIVVYSLYTATATNLPANHLMMLTIPLAMFAFLRYLYLVYSRGEGGAPDDLFWTDRPLIIACALWGAVAAAVLYLPSVMGYLSGTR
ncbi:MAG: decaprenyl-phosphate phosphoribosyltransferase [Anaerolineae bacterium]